MSYNRIQSLFDRLTEENPPFPPTDLYAEGWLLRLTMDWFEESQAQGNALSLTPQARWYSEARLASPFLHNIPNIDKRVNEGYTNADSTIGHFDIGFDGKKANLRLQDAVSQFVVIEAKIFSLLSSGVTNAPFYNQAARNIACMAEICQRADVSPAQIEKIGFYVLAPDMKITQGIFSDVLAPAHVKETVKRRVEMYEGTKDEWYEDWFLPLMQVIDIQAISWESILGYIEYIDTDSSVELTEFYERCLKYN